MLFSGRCSVMFWVMHLRLGAILAKGHELRDVWGYGGCLRS